MNDSHTPKIQAAPDVDAPTVSFARVGVGDVVLRINDGHEVLINAAEWVRIIASCSAAGKNTSCLQAARMFHDGKAVVNVDVAGERVATVALKFAMEGPPNNDHSIWERPTAPKIHKPGGFRV